MKKMELIMDESNLRFLAEERWSSRLPSIIKQAEVKALHNTSISNILCATKDRKGEPYFYFDYSGDL